MYYQNITELIGNTPLVKLNKVAAGIKATVLVKIEYFNPGNSVKDRIAITMIDDAERRGLIKPGGTIVECTSGNTGMGLALVAIARGYKCIVTMNDKQSKEKMDVLRAVGAEVVVCPTNVAPEDPRSYYSMARKIHGETPGSYWPNQYDNPANLEAHYKSTGPEIWRDTEGGVTCFAAGVGTAGTVVGTAKYLKEQNPAIKVVGIDTYGSVYKKYKDTGVVDNNEVYPYLVEGIGRDEISEIADVNYIDAFVKVTDKDGALTARRMAREEGIFIGWSCGSAVWGALEYARENLTEKDTLVILLPDHGSRYLGKVYNDVWMKDHGFLENRGFASAKDIVRSKNGTSKLFTIVHTSSVGEAVKLMQQSGVSQIPVVNPEGTIVGSLTDSDILVSLIENPEIRNAAVSTLMKAPFTFVALDNTVEVLSTLITPTNKALLVRDEANNVHIITQADLLTAIAK
jgi:cystathionine beta-synthase